MINIALSKWPETFLHKDWYAGVKKRVTAAIVVLFVLLNATMNMHAQNNNQGECILFRTEHAFLANPFTGSRTALTSVSSDSAFNGYAQSPDGKYAAFLHLKDIFASAGAGKATVKIKSLVTNQIIEIPILLDEVNGLGNYTSFAWSPDSTKLAYVATLERAANGITSHQVLVIVNADGSHLRLQDINVGSIYIEGWSSDSHFLALSRFTANNERLLWFWSVDIANWTKFSGHLTNLAMQAVWSTKGHQIAYVEQTETSSAHLILASPDTGIEQSFPIDFPENIIDENLLRWSPDNSHLAYVYVPVDHIKPHKQIDILGIDGTRVSEVATFDNMDALWGWSGDGKSMIFAPNDGKQGLKAFNVVKQSSSPLVPNVANIYKTAVGKLLYTWREGNLLNFDMMDIDGQHHIKVLKGMDKLITFQDLTPYTNVFVVLWETHSLTNPVTTIRKLTFIDVDGSYHTSTRDYVSSDLQDLRFIAFPDHNTIAYLSKDASNTSVEVFNIVTKEERIIASGSSLFVYGLVDSALVTVQPFDNKSKVIAYNANGTLVFQFNSSKSTILEALNAISFHVAPDGQTLAATIVGEGLELISLRDKVQHRIVFPNIAPEFLAWSSDSELLAFYEWPANLSVINKNGNLIWSAKEPKVKFVGWNACDF